MQKSELTTSITKRYQNLELLHMYKKILKLFFYKESRLGPMEFARDTHPITSTSTSVVGFSKPIEPMLTCPSSGYESKKKPKKPTP